MPRTYYSYRLGREVPLLSDKEWAPIGAFFDNYGPAIMKFKREQGCSLEEARDKNPQGQKALAAYHELTGVRLEHPEQIYALRLSLYGRPCPNCAKPFRTPQARMCPECGFQLPEGEIAGPLTADAEIS